eukprot:gnl/TRDRNA2_/TRDRNA2_187674_c0_seq1.p1 gnl/TRDRNA2_/TRDRNA2_187674_c0~~gnl/TRDRNA2_/TRDRNA2_187674_c0_seq1.p1  ORF type:complete len:419 (+),score=65.75 gnl/TRDRNA2_/TRDRNA2_187674_c0_seq1:95-1258(+)
MVAETPAWGSRSRPAGCEQVKMGGGALAVSEQWNSKCDYYMQESREELLLKIRRLFEWYFSDLNLATDHYLHRKISEALPEGWLCCSYVMNRKKLKELHVSPQLIFESMRSSFLETKIMLPPKALQTGKLPLHSLLYVRRRQPLPPLLPKSCRGMLKNGSPSELPTDPGEMVLDDRHNTMNRLRDQWRVHQSLGLKEVGDSTTVFREKPTNEDSDAEGVVIAVGYERVLYGDHGPYVELSESQIQWKAWPHYFDKRHYDSYYNEFYTEQSHGVWRSKWDRWDPNPTKGVLMLYMQRHTVADRPWAPGSSTSSSAVERSSGYADYRIGYYYIAADENLIEASSGLEKEKPKPIVVIPPPPAPWWGNGAPWQYNRQSHANGAPRAKGCH